MNFAADYSWFSALTDTAPSLETASYRFTPSTGAVNIIDDTMVQPNGIAIGPALPDPKNPNSTLPRTIYITDSGAGNGPIAPQLGSLGQDFNTTGKRVVYAFDRTSDGKHIVNKRPIWLTQDWLPDGLKVARNGYVRKLESCTLCIRYANLSQWQLLGLERGSMF